MQCAQCGHGREYIQTKQHLNRCCLSLQMYLKNQVSPLQLAYNIGLISLMMLSSLPTTVVIICPSLSWMSLKSRLIACWRKGGLPHPLLPMGTLCCLPPKKMAVYNYVWRFQVTECQHMVGQIPLTTHR